MQPPIGISCGEYLEPYANATGGSIYNPNASSDCQYCIMSTSDQYLALSYISYTTRWRDYGLGFAYIVFNIFMALLLYYLIRVKMSSGKPKIFEKLRGLFKKITGKDKIDTKAKAQAPQDNATPILPISPERQEEH
jgi:ATP-binding cassette subfamily G (WHITE) protein 2 (PDR)